MSCIKTGAIVFFEAYGCAAAADLYNVPDTDAVVIRTNGPMDAVGIYKQEYVLSATHRLESGRGDPGFWRPDLGVFCINKRDLVALPVVDHSDDSTAGHA